MFIEGIPRPNGYQEEYDTGTSLGSGCEVTAVSGLGFGDLSGGWSGDPVIPTLSGKSGQILRIARGLRTIAGRRRCYSGFIESPMLPEGSVGDPDVSTAASQVIIYTVCVPRKPVDPPAVQSEQGSGYCIPSKITECCMDDNRREKLSSNAGGCIRSPVKATYHTSEGYSDKPAQTFKLREDGER